MKEKEKNGYKSQDKQTKGVQKPQTNKALKGVTPSFTLDRALTYGVGIAVFFAGGYVIYYFVKKGFEGLEKDKTDDSKKVESGGTGKPILVYSEQIETPTSFPIQAANLQFPTYNKNVEILQSMLMRVFGNVLPAHGADGKFGYETLAVVKNYVNPSGVVTKADWENLVGRAVSMTEKAKRATEAIINQGKEAVIPIISPKPAIDFRKDLRYPRQEIALHEQPIEYRQSDIMPRAMAYYALEGLGSTKSGVEIF